MAAAGCAASRRERVRHNRRCHLDAESKSAVRSSFARRKTVKWEFERRFPARYTASKSPRRTSRASRGKSSRPALNGSEPMTAFLRRAASTLRPPAVFIRERNPCVLARRVCAADKCALAKQSPLVTCPKMQVSDSKLRTPRHSRPNQAAVHKPHLRLPANQLV